jgi:uncharacterized protein with PQ loop repeat
MNELSGILMAICFVVCYVPQIVKILKTKSVASISVGMYCIAALGNLFGIFYSLNNEEMLWLLVDSIICLILISIILFLQQKYK